MNKVTGRIVEDERVFGCMEFGIGSQGIAMAVPIECRLHTDGVILRPTIILDGVVFEEDGVYMDEGARKLCAEMGIEGY